MSAPTFSRFELASAAGGRFIGAPPERVEGLVIDSRKVVPGAAFLAIAGERFDGHEFLSEVAGRGAACAVVAESFLSRRPPLALPLLAVKDTLASLGALARYHRRRFDLPLVAITGSSGKTTTREMLGAILRTRGPALVTEGNLNNEVGVPLTLLGLVPEHERAVVELGMNHAGEIARLAAIAEPTVGLVTLAGPAHLEALGSLEAVADAKAELYFALPRGGVCVANADDPLMLRRALECGKTLLTFAIGRAQRGDVTLLEVLEHGREGLRFTLGIGQREVKIALPLVGLHNAANAAAAAAAAVALGCDDREIAAGLAEVKPVGRRLRVETLPSGVLLVDDCYNANPASMRAALYTLRDLARDGRRAVAVLGDMLELGAGEEQAHEALGREAAQVARVLFAFGPRSRATARAAREAGLELVVHSEEMDELLGEVKSCLRPDDVLLVKGSRMNRLERLVDALR